MKKKNKALRLLLQVVNKTTVPEGKELRFGLLENNLPKGAACVSLLKETDCPGNRRTHVGEGNLRQPCFKMPGISHTEIGKQKSIVQQN